MMNNEIKYFSIDDEIYPESLRRIAKPPKKLFYIGDLSLLKERIVGVVGSRKFTLYGKVISRSLGGVLSDAGVTVVSGLAYGIDAFAHTGVMNAGGKAIAVLGMGMNVFGPKQNMELYRWICENGLVLSEYEPYYPGGKQTFPERNRIISGLCEKLVLVEAGYKSGALITADCANEQGKDVYAVPGNINSQFSLGTNLLIREGAKPLVVLDDVVRDMGIRNNRIETEKSSLEADEIMVYESVSRMNGAAVNDISSDVGMKVQRVSAILTVLEIKGAVYSHAGKFFLAN